MLEIRFKDHFSLSSQSLLENIHLSKSKNYLDVKDFNKIASIFFTIYMHKFRVNPEK